MTRSAGVIAQEAADAVKGDPEASRLISEAIDSRDPGRIKTVLRERAGLDVTDEEINAALAETDDVMPYIT